VKKINMVIYHIIYITGLLILLCTSNNRYEWMQGMDSTIVQLPEDSSRNMAIGMTILTLILVVMQIVRFKFTKSHLEKGILIILTLLAIIVWAMKFS
jgi:uncharacterized membrane protein